MRISILQTDIVWENKQENLRRLREKLETLRGTTEIVVLPETFSTGFSMDTASLAHNGRNHRNTAPMVRRVPACSCRQLYCLRNSLGRRKAILLQPRILPYARRQCLLLRQTPPLPDGARDRTFHPRQPASHHPISRLEYTAACML